MPSPHAAHWGLDPAVAFLNHGSFGACPRPVLAEQARLRAQMEAEPVRFFTREAPALLDAARARLAAFVGARAEDLAFVSNATQGVNTVLAGLRLEPGDVVLTTDHDYSACRKALRYAAARAGARVEVARVPFPLRDPDEAVEAVLAAAGPRTRLCLLDHVTSPTGLVMPVERLVPALEARGVACLVDGAHGPGMVPLALEALGASWYTGNCHKWLCAPKGAAFLWARADRQPGMHPLSISHGYEVCADGKAAFRLEFDWTGTDDPTAFLCVPAAIDFLGGLLPGGWDALRAHNRALALWARRRLCEVLGVEPPAPETMIGSLAAVPLPEPPEGPPQGHGAVDPEQRRWLDEHGVEVPVVWRAAAPRRLVRVSAQLYNDRSDYERLAALLARC